MKYAKEIIRVLEQVKIENRPFNLRNWYADKNLVLYETPTVKEIRPCYTSACAGGYMALDPFFQLLGLRLEIKEEDDGSGGGSVYTTLTYGGTEGFYALEELLDLEEGEVIYIFAPRDIYLDNPEPEAYDYDIDGVIERVKEIEADNERV